MTELSEPVPFEELREGMSAAMDRTVTAEDVAGFADVTGDHNPLHFDAEFAATTVFATPIAHGILSAGYISALISARLPGPGTIYLSQQLKFRAPVRIGDTVTTRLVVTEILPDRRRVRLDTTCSVGEEVVLEGEALVQVPEPG
jgi:3-hydroxybutyryl-CoA dehydratase